jgi:hypothetical protein
MVTGASLSNWLIQPSRRQLAKGGALVAAGLGATAVTGCYARPFVTAIPYYRTLSEQQKAQPSQLRDAATQQRRQFYENALTRYYIPKGGGTIDWYNFADIVDWVAQHSPTDQDFRRDIWHLFGWRGDGRRSPFAKVLDPANRGLPLPLHNTHYQAEQMHHYLGGVTGNTDRIPSHLLNNPIYAYLYELKELVVRGRYNWGDVRLFNLSRQHRDDFLKYGRFTVGRNIRRMLLPFRMAPSRPQGATHPFQRAGNLF